MLLFGRQDPGRVFPGKRMAGKMGRKSCTIFSLQVYKVEPKRDLLFVLGSVPGPTGSWLTIRDGLKKPFTKAAPPPFPTFIPKPG